MDKYELIPEQLLYEGTISEASFFHPKQLSEAQILKTHSHDYLHKLNTLTLTRKEERAIGFPVKRSLVERGKYIAHGTYECILKAIDHGVALNIAGGTHHAFRDHGEGFCVFNDFAIASHLVLEQGIFHKILIVDLDVHQGNGTAKIFENDDRVFTFSMHGARNYPTRKERSDLDIGLPDGTTDGPYLKALKDALPRLIDTVAPDLILYLAGVDVLESDKLGRLSMSRDGCRERDLYVMTLCQQNDLPVAVSMGGGYSPKIADIIEAHANTFRVAAELFT